MDYNNKIYKYVVTIKKCYKLDKNKFKKCVKQNSPKEIIFTKQINKKAKIDLSTNKDKSIVCWFDNDIMYITTNDNKKIICEDITSLFSYFKSVEKIDISNLNTKNATSADCMFLCCENLLEIKGLNR